MERSKKVFFGGNFRGSHPDVFCKKGVLRNFVIKRDSGTGVFL